MRRLFMIFAVLLLAGGPAIADAYGQGRGQGHGRGRGNQDDRGSGPSRHDGDSGIQLEFHGRAGGPITDFEIRIARDHYRGHHAGCRNLPPGIRRNLARGKPIPPGLRRRCRAPSYMVEHLPSRPGYHYYIVGGGLAVVSATTGIIVDVHFRLF